MQSLCNFSKFIEELSLNNSRNYKISILEKYKDDEDIKYYLNFIYNPYIITGISNKKLQKTIDNPSSFDLLNIRTVKNILEYLKTHNTGRDIDILQVRSAITEILLEEKPENAMNLLYLFNNIVCKDVQLGIDVKTINKVIRGLIPEFNVQLANKYFEKPEVVEGKEFVLTTKIDGSRIIAMKDNGKVSFWTRQGQAYEGLVDLQTELENSPEDNFVFDGEIVAINTSKEDTYKNTMKLSRTKDLEKHGLKMLVFDYMPIKNFKDQICRLPYQVRRGVLTALFGFNSFTYFELLPILYQGTDTSKIIEILNEQTSKGEEGIMINIVDAPYAFKRTNNLLKVKKMKTLDLEVIGFEEGSNSNKGTLGALLVRYKDNNIVKVGSGFEKELRDEIWSNQTEWLGRIVEVQYFEETINNNGGKSIRFPVYKDYRTDKTEADY